MSGLASKKSPRRQLDGTSGGNTNVEGPRRFASALLPLALVPVWVHLIGTGRLDFGGGEKDLVWVLPWSFWSILYATSCFVLWHRGWPLARAMGRASIVGLAGVLLAALLLAAFGQLGVAGRL